MTANAPLPATTTKTRLDSTAPTTATPIVPTGSSNTNSSKMTLRTATLATSGLVARIMCCDCAAPPDSSGDEVHDDDAVNLTHVGTAAYDMLRIHHNRQHHKLWNVTSGQIVGGLDVTPAGLSSMPSDAAFHDTPHSDWLPEKMADIMARTEIWCDYMTLSPPDGVFLTHVKRALRVIAERAATMPSSKRPITIRIMFGHIIGMPVNVRRVMLDLTHDLPNSNNRLQLWVGAWRRGVSWNHAKIIAVDGLHLYTGGHNVWDPHYLRHNPVTDISLELRGRCAHDGHLFANDQWSFVKRVQQACCGSCINKLPDSMPLALQNRVTVSEWPEDAVPDFPPMYKKRYTPLRDVPDTDVPIITVGRYGSLLRYYRPADDAFLAMFDAAQQVIRLSVQDIGPVCIPGTKVVLPGCQWPKEYLTTLGRAIWERDVRVEIILSNPGSIPGGLAMKDGLYGNGWSCVDVAAEIIKTIKKQNPTASDAELRQKFDKNLDVCFLRRGNGSNKWADGMTLGLHSKHFIVDDVCFYVGSQNLYVCDLAEWGVIVDSEEQTRKVKAEYWDAYWAASFREEDCDVQAVMDGLNIDRDPETHLFQTPAQKQQFKQAAAMQANAGSDQKLITGSDQKLNGAGSDQNLNEGIEVEYNR